MAKRAKSGTKSEAVERKAEVRAKSKIAAERSRRASSPEKGVERSGTVKAVRKPTPKPHTDAGTPGSPGGRLGKTVKATEKSATKNAGGMGRNSKPVIVPAPVDPPAAPSPRKQVEPKVRTHLTEKQLREFRELLLAKRAEIAGDVRQLAAEAFRGRGTSSAEHSSMPIHLADLGSDNWEQEFTLGLLANERALVREIDEALARIEEKTYGVCMARDDRISVDRLRAKPWAKYCVEHTQAIEEGRLF